MSLKLENQTATLKHLNFRKEKHGEEKVSSVDLKLSMLTGAAVLERFDPGLEKFLFSNAQIRFPLMKPVEWENEIEHCSISLAGIQIEDVKMRKFIIAPKLDAAGNKQVELDFTLSYYPQKNNLLEIGEHVGDVVTLDIDSQELV